uniref:Cilia- and flagella-associated protein 206 n=1 Tax=Maylandia zebra TaxID=106582 RepID=A0A3P9CC12_9CICH
MSQAGAETLLKTVIGHIVHECRLRGHAVSETLAAFMVSAVVLDPRNGFNVDRTLTKDDVQKLEELCLDKLTEKCSPSLDTIKMQVCFDMNYTTKCEFLEDIHQSEESKLSPLCREITDNRVKSRKELDGLYQKITHLYPAALLCLTFDFSSSFAIAVLQSVFPQAELGNFRVALKRDQEQQLKELTMIVTGIRLFNKANKRGEEEVDIHELILQEALPVTSKSIANELCVTQTLEVHCCAGEANKL